MTGQPSNTEEEKKKVATEPNKEPVANGVKNNEKFMWLLLGCLAASVVISVLQQSEGSLQRWAFSMFEEHIVPPPTADKNVCTIQFCQS